MFNPLNVPMCLRIPDRLTDVISWHGHIPFAFALVELFHPRVIVELGVHKGDSYCAFCEAVSALRLDTRCYGVDTWEGDFQAGYYGEEVYRELKCYHDPRYGAFSKMVRGRFSAAVQDFKNGEIDLLHIDGMHTYEAVSYDFKTWVPKLSHRSIVLLHDIAVHEGDFGVWQLWGQLASRYPSFEFHHSSGLGVLGVGPDAAKEAEWLFRAETYERVRLQELFERLGQAVAGIDKRWDKVEDDLRQALEAREAEVSSARENINALVAEIEQARNNINLLANQIEEARAAHAARDKVETDLRQALENLMGINGQLKFTLDSILGSFSYKVLHPLDCIRRRRSSKVLAKAKR